MKSKTSICIITLFVLTMVFIAEAKITVLGELTHEFTTQQGKTYQGVITLSNNGDEPQETKVYQTDYLFFCDGRDIYGEPGELPRSNAGWITFSPKRFIIPPKSTYDVNFSIQIPQNESLVGTYWSLIMVEGVPLSSLESTIPNEGKSSTMGIAIGIRYAVQIVAHIEETGKCEPNFIDMKLEKKDNTKFLQIDMENTGERWMRPTLLIELYDDSGEQIGTYEGGKLRIYPGTSVRFSVNMTDVPKGNYKAMIIADCGNEDIFGATFTLSLK